LLNASPEETSGQAFFQTHDDAELLEHD
jgi:hypothetical protein